MAANISNQADRIDPPPAPPMILAPAGSKPSFLAAQAAGADAVYCGLKSFSARMEAKNFTLEELHGLVELAHSKGTHVYVTLNTLLRPGDLDTAGRLLDQLGHHVRPDAIIVQDLAMAQLVRQTGFQGEVHWSTLSNMSFPAALALIKERLPIDRLVLPRELTVDEIKALAAACPPGLGLEVFIHGALCYGVSGRCYWSSFSLEAKRIIQRKVFSHRESVPSPHILVLVADFFMRCQEVGWTVGVSGVYQKTLVVIIRNDGFRKDAGTSAIKAFGRFGAAGGHKAMARAEIPLASLESRLAKMDAATLGGFVTRRFRGAAEEGRDRPERRAARSDGQA